MSFNASDNNRHDPTVASLGRYWDEVVHGRPAAPGDLEPTLAETVQRLHARDDAPGADAAFAARLLTQLEGQIAMKQLDAPDLFGPLSTVAFPGNHPYNARQRAPSSIRGWPFAHFASAALVVATIAVAYLAFGQSRLGTQDEPAAGFPAVLSTPDAPASPAADGILASFTLPAGSVPETVYVGQNSYTIPAGSIARWEPHRISATCCNGPRFNYVLEGTYTVRGDGSMHVLRAGAAAPEEVPAGTEIALGPGDALLSQMADAFDATNSSSTPALVLDGILFAGDVSTDPIPQESSGRPAWLFHDQDIILDPQPVPDGAVTLRMQRITLAPGDVHLRPPGAVLQLAVGLGENLVVTNNPANDNPFSLTNLGEESVDLYLLILEPAAAASGMSTPAPPS